MSADLAPTPMTDDELDELAASSNVNTPRLVAEIRRLRAAAGPGGDGFGPMAIGHRMPAIRTPSKIATQVARLTVNRGPGYPPLVPEERLEAMLRALGDRLADAREDRDSGEGAVRFRWHGGVFREFRGNTDDRY